MIKIAFEVLPYAMAELRVLLADQKRSKVLYKQH